MTLVIAFDVVCFVASTVREIRHHHGHFFYVVEAIASTIFLGEYVLRLATISQTRKFRHPVWGRLGYVFTWRSMIDLFSSLPFFVELLFGYDLPTTTWLRIFRVFRIMKTESYVKVGRPLPSALPPLDPLRS